MWGVIDVAAVRRGAGACCVSLACMMGVACGDEPGVDTSPARLVELRTPPLGCFEPVESTGNCRRSADCTQLNERCVRDESGVLVDRVPVPLTCAPAIGSGAARAACKGASDCASGLCAITGACLEPCASDDDCAYNEACRPIETTLAGAGLAPVMACTRALALPVDVNLATWPAEQPLGRGSNQVAVPGATETGIVYVQADCGKGMDLLSVRVNDDDLTVYSRDSLRNGTTQQNTILHDGSGLAMLIYPNNPLLAPSAKGLTLGVKVSSTQRADVVVAARKPGRGVLDLNVFYVGGGAEAVKGGYHPGEPDVARMLREFDTRLRSIGMSLGQVNELDVVGSLREELSVLEVPHRTVDGRDVEGRPQRLDELFRLSAGLENSGVNVFLVSDMGDYIGIAGSIPGPLGLHGTDRSGVALAVGMFGEMSGADQVLLHEIAHYLGLFHTTESNGVVLDPLEDTEECPLSRDEDEDGTLSSDECHGHGAENLMFWTGPGTRLTPQQVQVLSSAVVLR